MPSRPSKRGQRPSTDPNVSAFEAVQALTGRAGDDRVEKDEQALRSEAARILGRLGGSKGGKARAANLSKKRRSEIAKKAASARWAAVSGAKEVRGARTKT
jgi:hypothetical protein